MCKPFLRACNYALETISTIEINGLPKFSEENQIVFVRNHGSENHLWESQVKPGIALLKWDLFKWDQELPDCTPYSQSYEDDVCVSKYELDLTWRAIRSTVEMDVAGPPRRREWTKKFDTDFGALKELPLYTPVSDAPEPEFFQEQLPANECERRSFSKFP